jgi:hypothetical protein
VTPFEWTRGRLLFAGVSLIVYLSGELLNWRNPTSGAAETISWLMAGICKLLSQQNPATSNR